MLNRRRQPKWPLVLPLLAATGLSCADSFDRQPLARSPGEPITLSPNWTANQPPGEIDRQPEIILVDAIKGRYALRWIGHDGQRKEITYYEPDRVQVIVRASVSTGTVRKFRYQYEVINRSTSGQDVFGVAIQSFGEDAQLVAPSSDGRRVGQMTKSYPEFSVGMWYRVAFEADELSPGTVQRIALESDAAPALVYVRAHGGPLGMKGVGEYVPEVLLANLPGYAAWPLGMTIGPVADVGNAEYAFGRHGLDELVQLMAAAGWLSGSAKLRYEQLIEDDSYAELLSVVAEDVNRKNAAPEVAYALNRILMEQSGSAEADRQNVSPSPASQWSGPTLTASGYEDSIFADAATTCVRRAEGLCI